MALILNNGTEQHQLTEEEARKGGINSGKVRAEKKTLREKAKLLMSLSVKDPNDIDKLKELGVEEKDMDIEMMNIIHMLNIIKKENFNSVGAFNSLKDLTDGEAKSNETPVVSINIVDNSNLEKTMYEGDE